MFIVALAFLILSLGKQITKKHVENLIFIRLVLRQSIIICIFPVFLVAGRKLYFLKKPQGNILVRVAKCISVRAIFFLH